jgi:hypothetical protein
MTREIEADVGIVFHQKRIRGYSYLPLERGIFLICECNKQLE